MRVRFFALRSEILRAQRPYEYEVPPHLGAARLGVSVTNKVTGGMEGAIESFLPSPHTTLADYALVVTAI